MSNKLVVHGRATSSNVQTVMWAITELGLDYERLDVGGAFGKTDTPEYGAMNPNRLVPVVQDGDLTLFESAAIVRYLGAQYGNEAFWPSGPGKRAELDVWAEWAKGTFARAVMSDLFWTVVRTKAADRNMEALAKSVANMGRLAVMANDRLGDGPYLGGSDLTFADLILGHSLYRYYTMDVARVDAPNLAAYYERLTQRPTFADHVMVDYSSLRAE